MAQTRGRCPAVTQTVHSWAEAVAWLRAQPDRQAEVLNNYFDLPIETAAERFAGSEEFSEVSRILGCGTGRRVLDFGAGNGIASLALARANWHVTAFEPDPSDEVGAGAIRRIARRCGVEIDVVEQPNCAGVFSDESFDAVYARQVLHHVSDLDATVRDLARVLRRGGRLLATREHVVSNEVERAEFLRQHPLHRLYGGENAYRLAQYRIALERAGLVIERMWGPTESILNFYPGTERDRLAVIDQVGRGFGRHLRWLPGFNEFARHWITWRDRTPGRLYSFLAVKQ